MAFLQAIGSAAIALEFARNFEKIKLLWRNAQCKDTIEFGQERARLFLDKLESGNEAYSAVNRHNSIKFLSTRCIITTDYTTEQQSFLLSIFSSGTSLHSLSRLNLFNSPHRVKYGFSYVCVAQIVAR